MEATEHRSSAHGHALPAPMARLWKLDHPQLGWVAKSETWSRQRRPGRHRV